jgi:hypothetical protein
MVFQSLTAYNELENLCEQVYLPDPSPNNIVCTQGTPYEIINKLRKIKSGLPSRKGHKMHIYLQALSFSWKISHG